MQQTCVLCQQFVCLGESFRENEDASSFEYTRVMKSLQHRRWHHEDCMTVWLERILLFDPFCLSHLSPRFMFWGKVYRQMMIHNRKHVHEVMILTIWWLLLLGYTMSSRSKVENHVHFPCSWIRMTFLLEWSVHLPLDGSRVEDHLTLESDDLSVPERKEDRKEKKETYKKGWDMISERVMLSVVASIGLESSSGNTSVWRHSAWNPGNR